MTPNEMMLMYRQKKERRKKYYEQTSNRPIPHSRFDSKIIRFYAFLRVIYLATVKIVPGLSRALESTTNLSTILSPFVTIRI